MADDPYSVGFFETIIDVHFGKPVYLVVLLNGANISTVEGPYSPAPSVSTASVASNPNKRTVKLLDTYIPPGQNDAGSSFTNCYYFPLDISAQAAWVEDGNLQNGFPGVSGTESDGSCFPPDPTIEQVAPVNFEQFSNATIWYLYEVTPSDDLLTVNVEGLEDFFNSGVDTGTWSQTTINGTGLIQAFVFSTVKGKITKIDQLIDLFADGKPRPTEDDNCSLNLTGDNQGSYGVNVALDKDKADAQTDNYGKTFQPYKVTLTPDLATDNIPSQPPIRLG